MATTAVSAPAPEPEARLSTLQRITGVLFTPKKAFADIAAKPNWLGPLLMMTVIGLSLNIFLANKVDWRAFAEEQLASSPRGQQIPPEQKDLAIERASKGNQYFCYVRGLTGSFFLAAVLGLVYWAAYALLAGARLTFGKSLAVVTYAMIPGAIRELLGILILALKDPSTIGNPYNFIGTNPGAYMSLDSPKWLSALASSLDLLVIWSLVLTAIGFHCMDPKKVKMSKSAGVVVSVYVFFTLIGVTIAWVFS
jgi:hypothetical protein